MFRFSSNRCTISQIKSQNSTHTSLKTALILAWNSTYQQRMAASKESKRGEGEKKMHYLIRWSVWPPTSVPNRWIINSHGHYFKASCLLTPLAQLGILSNTWKDIEKMWISRITPLLIWWIDWGVWVSVTCQWPIY